MLLLQLQKKKFRHGGDLLFSTLQTLTPKDSNFIIPYLITTFSFSHTQALKASKDISHIKSPEKPNTVIDFFLRRGLSFADISSLVLRRPDILSFNVSKTLIPKFNSLSILNFSQSQLADLLVHNPNSLCYLDICPKIQFLQSLLPDNDTVLKALKKDQFLLGCSLEKTLIPNLSLLRECGLTSLQISKLMTVKRGFLTQQPARVKSVIAWVQEFGVDTRSPMFYHLLSTLMCFSRETLGAKKKLWMSLGLSDTEFITAFVKHPSLVHISQENARAKMEFFKEIGCEIPYLVGRPGMFTYSLEKRLRPRSMVMRVLKREELPGGELDVFNAMTLKEEMFLKKFVSPNEEKVPGLGDGYLAACVGDFSKMELLLKAGTVSLKIN